MQGALARRKVAHIDLSARTTRSREIPQSARKMLLGGRGINMLALLKYATPDIEPLSDNAPLIIGNGLLSGIHGISLARTSVSGISPESGLLGDSSVGGHFCAALRRTAFDHLIITGKFERPSLIVLDGGDVSLEDGAWLWGRDTYDAHEAVKSRFGRDAEALLIGLGSLPSPEE